MAPAPSLHKISIRPFQSLAAFRRCSARHQGGNLQTVQKTLSQFRNSPHDDPSHSWYGVMRVEKLTRARPLQPYSRYQKCVRDGADSIDKNTRQSH